MQGNGKIRTLRVGQVAEMLCCSRSFVYELLQAGKIKGLRIGLGERRGAVRVMADSLEEFLRLGCLHFEAECLGLDIPSRVSTFSTDSAVNFKQTKKRERIES